MSKSRGILFSAPMVRALLAGTKTQTRRVIKPDGRYRLDLVCPSDGGPARCPQGAPGDRLWVREAWRADVAHDALPPREIPPGSPVFMEASALNWQGGPHDGTPGKLRPGMFMPRWASRILLEVTEVRVERLQDISEADNDALLADWPLPRWFGAPVWHMHESLERLERLASAWPRICIGSSGQFSTVGSPAWWGQMARAMRVVCNDDGEPLVKLHGLRMLSPEVFTRLPFASADSTNIARNIGIDQAWRGTYSPPTKEARAALMRARIEHHNAPARWAFQVPEFQPEDQGALW